ncbi:LamG domain-containing protein [Aeoliella sp.]|uniref:LamG domain-containing protein n=1 Tax=Aeoliella sp. TaxID=2795800 RepID=UPI003CCBC972
MERKSQLTNEHTALVLEVLSNEATAEQVSKLDQLLKSRPELIESVVDLVGQDAWLAWSSTDDLTQQDASGLVRSMQVVGSHDELNRVLSRDSYKAPVPWPWLLAASVALLATGALVGAISTYSYSSKSVVADSDPSSNMAGESEAELDYSARVVEMSACRWNPAKGNSLLTNSVIRKGESINLLEGLAQLSIENTSGRSTLDIEGPAAVVLTADVGCSVSHGRVCADVQSLGDPFTIDTPCCLVRATGDHSNFGVAVDGRRVEVHVFDGQASVVVPWGVEQVDSLSSELQAGESLILAPDSSGRMVHTRAKSNPLSFTARTSMKSNHLVIPAEYPDAVLSHDPLLYWRFEQADSPEINNEAGERYRGIVHGKLIARTDGSNGYIDFGGGVSEEELAAYIATEEPVAIEASDSYTLEMWVKPSHCHHCALASVILPEPNKDFKKHGILLELGGPNAMEYSFVVPGKLRYVHRSVPSDVVSAGTSCYSETKYKTRQWQHLVAMKSPEQLQLYLDGKLVASAEDNTHLTDSLRVVLGQLDDLRYLRRYVGQMDEVALYPSALSEEVVLEHFNMVKDAECEHRGRINTDDI